MTPNQAVNRENKIKKIGTKITVTGMTFHKLVREFRLSGAWALTPEHHGTFSKWCFWLAPQIKMAPETLRGYGSPNYESRYSRLQNRALRSGLSIQALNVSGEPAKWLGRAIKVAHANGVTETRRNGTERALIHIAKFFMAHRPHKPTN